jgi:hypothetical protein
LTSPPPKIIIPLFLAFMAIVLRALKSACKVPS